MAFYPHAGVQRTQWDLIEIISLSLYLYVSLSVSLHLFLAIKVYGP